LSSNKVPVAIKNLNFMETFAIVIFCWLITYLLHSSAFYGLAKALSHTAAFANTHARELLWKAALVGGGLTASIQVFTGAGLFVGVYEPPANFHVIGVQEPPAYPQADGPVAELVPAQPLASDEAAGVGVLGQAVGEIANETSPSVWPTPQASPTGWLSGLANSPVSFSELAQVLVWLVWLPVVCFLFIRLLVQKYLFLQAIAPRRRVTDEAVLYQLFRLCNRAGVGKKIGLTFSERLGSPLALGSSEICLPARSLTDLRPDQQQSMLAHELAHLVRGDFRWLQWGNFLDVVFFFQPFNRLMRQEMLELVEQNCDAWAISHTGQARPLADCLVKVAEWLTEPQSLRFASGMALRQSSLRQRVKQIISECYFTQPPSNRMKIVVMLVAVFVFATLVIPGQTWVSLQFNHQGVLGRFFNHQELSLGLGQVPGPAEAPDQADLAGELAELSALQAEAAAELAEFQAQAGAELAEQQAELAAQQAEFQAEAEAEVAALQAEAAVASHRDTLQFGDGFVLVSRGQGDFDIYQNGKRIAPADYGKYREVFVVKNGRVDILAQGRVRMNLGRTTPVPSGFSGLPATLWPTGAFVGLGGYTSVRIEHGRKVVVEFDPKWGVRSLSIDGQGIDQVDFERYQDLIANAKLDLTGGC
jgi:beta-lactamase regulating signal transducer with metallopeptidase domain